jgi:hypothetical protein
MPIAKSDVRAFSTISKIKLEIRIWNQYVDTICGNQKAYAIVIFPS